MRPTKGDIMNNVKYALGYVIGFIKGFADGFKTGFGNTMKQK